MIIHELVPGQVAELVAEVTKELGISRMGAGSGDQLSTPSLLALMEECSMKISDKSLAEGYTTVGYAVDQMRHLAPTPVGAKVCIRAVLSEVDESRLTFSIEAFEGGKKIGVAVHKRAVVSTRQ